MGYNESMTALADAVRAKSGATGKLTVDQMTEAVNGITSGAGEGGGGTDTSDATVTADKLLKGVTAYGANGKVTGSIETVTPTLTDNIFTVPSGFIEESQTLTVPEIPPVSVHLNGVSIGPGYNPESKSITVGKIASITEVTPGTSDVVIPADTYIAGALTVKGDPNLTPENIKEGVPIFGVVGSFAGGGGATAFYKCASVDKTNSTWSGYKAVLSGGVYTFEDSVTSGLTYGSGFTPKINEVYSSDALIHVKNLYDGSDPTILLEVSFANSNTTPTKGNINITGEYESNSDGLFFYDGDIGTDVALEDIADEFTIYCEVKTNNEDRFALFAANDDDQKIGIDTNGGTWNIWAGSDWWDILEADSGFEPDEYSSSGRSESEVRYGEFQKIVFTHSGNNWDLYVDGVNALHRIRDGRIRTGGTLRFNRWGHGGFTGWDTTYKTILVLQRALTADEVAAL